MNMRNLSFIFLLVALVFSSAGADKYGGDFLNLPVGARALALGGAFGPLADDASAIFWNPAGLGSMKRPQIMLVHADLYTRLASHDYLGMVWPLNSKLVIGLGWNRLAVDEIPRFSYIVGTPPSGTFSDNENAFYVSSGYPFRKVMFSRPWQMYVGGSIKTIYSKLDARQANGLGLDVGTLLQVDLADWLAPRAEDKPLVGMLPVAISRPVYGTISLSLVGQDLGGTSISWNTASLHNDIRPAVFKLGLAYQQPVRIIRSRVTLTWEGATDEDQKGRYGAEIKYRDMVSFRAGHINAKAVVGAGLEIWRITVDYAYNNHDLGNSHRIGASFYLK